MKAYIRLFQNLIICITIFYAVKVYLYLLQPNKFRRELLLYRSKIRTAVAVYTLDKDNLNDFYWKENITKVIEQYQAEGYYSFNGNSDDDDDDNSDENRIRHVFESLGKSKHRKQENPIHHDIALSQIPAVRSGLIMDWWYDTCFQRTTWERTWYPLFPELPQNRTITKTAGDERFIVGNYMRRVYGFLYTNESGFYSIQLLSRDGAEVMIADTNTRLDDDSFRNSIKNSNLNDLLESAESVYYAKLTKNDMEEQELLIQMEDMFASKPLKVWLTGGVAYFIEFIQGGDLYSIFQLRWKLVGSNHKLKMIDENNLFFLDTMLRESVSSKLLKHSKLRELFPMSNEERRRNAFFKIPRLKGAGEKVRYSPYRCEPNRLRPAKYEKLYDGFLKNVDNTISYPREFFLFKYHSRLNDILMNEEEAVKMAEEVFEKLNILYNGKLQLNHIVHVQKNLNDTQRWKSKWKQHKDWRDIYYFIELDVKMHDDYQNKAFRTSHFVRPSPGGPCFIREYQWRSNVTINLLTSIKNQAVWFRYLVKMVKRLMLRIKEYKIQLVIVDNNSTDGDYESVLAESKVPYKYLKLNDGKFNKVKSLNLGLSHITDENSIVFIQDLHLQLPMNIFDRIRKMTIQGQTAFAPTLLKFACGEHEQYTQMKNSVWLDDGTGMLAMYKSDFTSIGGFNETLFSTKWGGEDWEIIDRIVGKGLYVIHHRLPRFYHLYHPRRGMWTGSAT